MSTADHKKLQSMWDNGIFEPSIHHIRFPVFKNLATDLRIEFDYPVTAIIGPNGCNKTAILRALQGAPHGNDLGNYWFGTAMDEISSDERHRFIYGRRSQSSIPEVEVVKTRIGRIRSARSTKEIDPDLFEPSRPLLMPPDNMERYPFEKNPPPDGSKTRWNAIKKNVEYIDFRNQISAFDWFFYQAESAGSAKMSVLQGLRERKDKIRRRSLRLARAVSLKLSSDDYYGIERIMRPVQEIEDDKKKWVERLLGRSYSSIRIIEHRYFRPSGGWTVLLRSNDLSYSEAFAGSGEFAAVMLVNRVLSAPPGSLILLDEPEISLHPAAQRTAVEFFSFAAKILKHQIIYATHSPDMIRDLPPNAIKVLTIRDDDGTVDIPTQSSSPRVAFETIGASYERPTVIVEDKLARALVEKALDGTSIASSVDIRFIPGGAQTLWSHYLPMWAHEGRRNLLLLLDGDQQCENPRPSNDIPLSEREAELQRSLNSTKPKLPYGEGETDSAQNRAAAVERALEWRRLYVDFLPCITPEEFIWKELGRSCESDYKNAWRSMAQERLGAEPSGDEIFVLQRIDLNSLTHENEVLKGIRKIVDNFQRGVVA